MELVRIICATAFKHNFYFKVVHIKGIDSKIADRSSRKGNFNVLHNKQITGEGLDCRDVIKNLLNC